MRTQPAAGSAKLPLYQRTAGRGPGKDRATLSEKGSITGLPTGFDDLDKYTWAAAQ